MKQPRIKYVENRERLVSVIYGYGGTTVPEVEKSIIVDRLQAVVVAIDQSSFLRDELIAIGLAPEVVQEGLNYHMEFLRK